jgi:hypothetical protein
MFKLIALAFAFHADLKPAIAAVDAGIAKGRADLANIRATGRPATGREILTIVKDVGIAFWQNGGRKLIPDIAMHLGATQDEIDATEAALTDIEDAIGLVGELTAPVQPAPILIVKSAPAPVTPPVTLTKLVGDGGSGGAGGS